MQPSNNDPDPPAEWTPSPHNPSLTQDHANCAAHSTFSAFDTLSLAGLQPVWPLSSSTTQSTSTYHRPPLSIREQTLNQSQDRDHLQETRFGSTTEPLGTSPPYSATTIPSFRLASSTGDKASHGSWRPSSPFLTPPSHIDDKRPILCPSFNHIDKLRHDALAAPRSMHGCERHPNNRQPSQPLLEPPSYGFLEPRHRSSSSHMQISSDSLSSVSPSFRCLSGPSLMKKIPQNPPTPAHFLSTSREGSLPPAFPTPEQTYSPLPAKPSHIDLADRDDLNAAPTPTLRDYGRGSQAKKPSEVRELPTRAYRPHRFPPTLDHVVDRIDSLTISGDEEPLTFQEKATAPDVHQYRTGPPGDGLAPNTHQSGRRNGSQKVNSEVSSKRRSADAQNNQVCTMRHSRAEQVQGHSKQSRRTRQTTTAGGDPTFEHTENTGTGKKYRNRMSQEKRRRRARRSERQREATEAAFAPPQSFIPPLPREQSFYPNEDAMSRRAGISLPGKSQELASHPTLHLEGAEGPSIVDNTLGLKAYSSGCNSNSEEALGNTPQHVYLSAPPTQARKRGPAQEQNQESGLFQRQLAPVSGVDVSTSGRPSVPLSPQFSQLESFTSSEPSFQERQLTEALYPSNVVLGRDIWQSLPSYIPRWDTGSNAPSRSAPAYIPRTQPTSTWARTTTAAAVRPAQSMTEAHIPLTRSRTPTSTHTRSRVATFPTPSETHDIWSKTYTEPAPNRPMSWISSRGLERVDELSMVADAHVSSPAYLHRAPFKRVASSPSEEAQLPTSEARRWGTTLSPFPHTFRPNTNLQRGSSDFHRQPPQDLAFPPLDRDPMTANASDTNVHTSHPAESRFFPNYTALGQSEHMSTPAAPSARVASPTTLPGRRQGPLLPPGFPTPSDRWRGAGSFT